MAAPGPKTPASKKYERARDPKKALRGLWADCSNSAYLCGQRSGIGGTDAFR